MKKILLISTLFISNLFAMDAQDIIKKVEEVESVPHAISVIRQTITTSSKKTRTFEIRGFTLDDKQLQIFDKPARVRGEKILMLNDGDDIWAYSPKTRRTRHLATHMKRAKVMGSDFSYEDFATGDYLEKFTISLLGSEKAMGEHCYKLELLPTKKGPSYTKEIIWVSQKNFVTRVVEFFDKEGILKRLEVSDIKTIDGVITPWKMVMKNIRNGGSTEIENISIDYKTKPKTALFTQQGLSKK